MDYKMTPKPETKLIILKTIEGDGVNADIYENFNVRIYDADYKQGTIGNWRNVKNLEHAEKIVALNLSPKI